MSHTCLGIDFKASTGFLSTEEDSCVGLISGALGSNLDILTKEGGVVTLITLALHIRGNNAILNALEPVSDSVSSVKLALISSIEELTGIQLVLRSRVTNLILEELLLSLFEFRVITNGLRHVSHGVLCLALPSARLLELGIAQLVHLFVILAAIELGIGLHHWLLFVLWHVVHPT